MKEKICFYSKKLLVFLMAVVSLLTLCFNLLRFKQIDHSVGSTSTVSLNGFGLMSFGEIFQMSEFSLFYAWPIMTIFIIAIILIAFSLINFFIKSDNADFVIIAFSLFIAIAYMCLGVVYVKYIVSLYANSIDYSVTTASFVPLIMEGVLTCLYLVITFISKQPQDKERALFKSQNSASTATYIADLKQLKELFDTEVINQEEFDAKKKEILGL